MTNPVQRAFNASRTTHKTIMGVSVTITRGDDVSDPVTATIGFSGDMTYDGDGTAHYTKHRAFLIDVADYDVGNGPTNPQRHDVIKQLVNGNLLEFEVFENLGNSVINYDDTDRTWWRVATKEK